jgi:hypothetical protein
MLVKAGAAVIFPIVIAITASYAYDEVMVRLVLVEHPVPTEHLPDGQQ